ncbi:MAG: glycosyltransferase family 2 protein [Calditrichaeota bacterium]|nr:glycosyltransferase family 2 protein [Calditrichota bacterium]
MDRANKEKSSKDNNLPLVSIVIPMYNEAGNIERCIGSIQGQNYPQEKIEIIVVDGNSSDGSREKVLSLAKNHFTIRLLTNPKRKTPSSLNMGIKNASGEVVIILGAHTKIKEDFVSQNIRLMKEMNIKCVGGTQINVGENFMQRAIGYAMGHPFGLASAPYRYGKKEKFVDTVVYAAYRKELFDEVGYFDEDLFISEDAELNWRIRQAGYKIFYSPKIVSYYYPRKTMGKLINQLFRYGILRVNVIKKHLKAIKLMHLIPPAFALATIVFLIAGIFKPFFLVPLAAIWGLYLVLAFISSLQISLEKGFQYFSILPIIFTTIHLSWGIGFLWGIFVSKDN